MSQAYRAGQLLKLLPYWIEHTAEHAGEISLWQSRLEGQLNETVAEQLRVAEATMLEARQALAIAYDTLSKTAAPASEAHEHDRNHEGGHTHDHEHPGHSCHSHHHHHR